MEEDKTEFRKLVDIPNGKPGHTQSMCVVHEKIYVYDGDAVYEITPPPPRTFIEKIKYLFRK